MNLILLFSDDFIGPGNLVRLEGRRFRHVRDVIRPSIGDELAVGIAGGSRGRGTVVRLDAASAELEVLLDKDPPAALPLTLVLALPRPKVARRLLRSLSSLGVKRIILLNAARVEKSYWQTPFLREESIRDQLILGLEQAGDTNMPEVLLRPLFKPFVEDELPGIMKNTLALVAHLANVGDCPRNVGKPVTLVIGPEGGFIPYEVDKLLSCGFEPVRMGERVLTTETAAPALIARLF